jgi:catechol 2,3-dioxygenase-like lactoylglutathione lyase family enzyme
VYDTARLRLLMRAQSDHLLDPTVDADGPQILRANFTSVGLRREPQLGADRNTLPDFDFHPERWLFTIAVQVDDYGFGHQAVAHLDWERQRVVPGAPAAKPVNLWHWDPLDKK